jgi:hypothetical protein
LHEHGCNGEATSFLSGGLEAPDLSLAQQLAFDAYARSEADSRVRNAMAAWSQCMGNGGYDYSTIWEPNDRDWPRPAGPEETATAQTDVQCKLGTNLVGIWVAVESAYQMRQIEEHSEDPAHIESYLDVIYRNATEILGQ